MRTVVDGDREAAARLLLDAYRGTIDDEGETEQDALDAIDHYLATIVRRASVVLVEGGELVALSFVVVVAGRHFIDPVVTAAGRKQRGLATLAVTASLQRLHDELGTDEVGAVITDGNAPSERLFAGLRFERIGPWPRRPEALPSSPAP